MTGSTRVTTAMVLCAGLGTRMRPLTNTLPKPLVPFLGRPLIDHILDRLAAAGIERIVINVHYLADLMEAHVRARRDVEIIISDERSRLLDTGGGIAAALDALGPEPFLVHNADSLWFDGDTSTLGRMIEAWDPAAMDALLLVCPWAQVMGFSGAGDFFLNDDGRIARRGAAAKAQYVFAGVSIASPRLFSAPSECAQRAFSLNEPWDKALAAGRLFGVAHQGAWFHIGDPAALSEGEKRVRELGLADRGQAGT